MRSLFLFAFITSSLLLFQVTNAGGQDETTARTNPAICRWVSSPPTIDGRLDELDWQEAEALADFGQPWIRDAAARESAANNLKKTKAMLLWDREYLYFAGTLEDADLFADVKEHDGKTWENDVFELFLKPSNDHAGYYEFQVNAAGTEMDMFLPSRGSGGYDKYVSDGKFHLETKVRLEGTLNEKSDVDQSWTVEGRIPWSDFSRTGGRPRQGERWKFAISRYDYHQNESRKDGRDPDLSTTSLTSSQDWADFHHYEDFREIEFRGPIGPQTGNPNLDQWRPWTTSKVFGSPEPPPPYRPVRVRPELKIDWPICVVNIPGTEQLLVIDEQGPYGNARLALADRDGKLKSLVQYDGVAYSIAFHPKFSENGFVYVGWNGAGKKGPKQTRVTRYQMKTNQTTTEPTIDFDPDSATTIIEWDSDGHNGGAITFGLDGMMYVTSGDGTSDSDRNVVGQGLDHLLSKALRIDVDHPADGKMYSIPDDNPFLKREGVQPETFAYGLRNPWRMTTDPKTGRIWIGNNGQDLFEQIYLLERGANYGWSVFEGSQPFYPNRQLGPDPHTKPIFEHHHTEARSLTGGVVYYGKKLPELYGAYLYADHSTGKIWGAKLDDQNKIVWHKELADTVFQITSIAIDADGELLIADQKGNQEGGVYSLEPNDSPRDPASFPKKLSETGLFESVVGYVPSRSLIPYGVNSPLWSDGALKSRFIALPPTMVDRGQEVPSKIDFTETRGWNFPNDTVIVKSFAFETAVGGKRVERWIETRLLHRYEGEWIGYSYMWNEEQTDAELVVKEGADRTYRVIVGGVEQDLKWHYPSRTECMVCHSRAANYVLGLSTSQMNGSFHFDSRGLSQPDPSSENQLERLERMNLLRIATSDAQKQVVRNRLENDHADWSKEKVEEEWKRLTSTTNQRNFDTDNLFATDPELKGKLANPYDSTADLTTRAKSYLHANCSVCHVEAGGGNAQIDLEFETALEKMKLVDIRPVHHTFDLPDARLVAPGSPERSVLLHRVSKRGTGQMPPVATNIVDKEAVAMLKEWIEELRK